MTGMEIYKRILVAVDGSESSSAAFFKSLWCGKAQRGTFGYHNHY
ncbi:hypothetical protein MCOL2_12177 [Listeria fleischmannii FSL S10-1203]|uniref:Universal stress protein n=1 Tax=Listeria fleischmannii FSL S10-1203 TaxID=1265822 RepID=W7DM09_9LIST|nr:hypothetical protein MCOL2_12177 [Listeria fleischmannii FSL S10-1203]